MSLMIVIAVLFAVHIYLGYRSGFVKVVFSLVSWIIGIIAAFMLAPMASQLLMEKTELPIAIETAIYDQVTNAAGGLNVEGLETLPESIQQVILGEYEGFDDLLQHGAVQAIDISGLTDRIVDIVALILVLIVVRLALIIVEMLLSGVSKLPLIGSANRMLGAVAGAAKGLIWAWVVLALISIAAFTGVNTTLIAQVGESSLLTWLYNNNMILNMLNMFM